MRRQRNMAHMKEQIKTPEKELNTMEISNLSDAEFKTLVIKMLKELSEDLSSIKKIQSEMKDPLIDIKSNLSQTQSPSITWLCFKNSICWYDRFCTISTLTKFNHVHSSSQPFKSSRFVYTGGGKSRFISVYAKHRVYSGVIINYCIIFHMNNHKPTFVPPCISMSLTFRTVVYVYNL